MHWILAHYIITKQYRKIFSVPSSPSSKPTPLFSLWEHLNSSLLTEPSRMGRSRALRRCPGENHRRTQAAGLHRKCLRDKPEATQLHITYVPQLGLFSLRKLLCTYPPRPSGRKHAVSTQRQPRRLGLFVYRSGKLCSSSYTGVSAFIPRSGINSFCTINSAMSPTLP